MIGEESSQDKEKSKLSTVAPANTATATQPTVSAKANEGNSIQSRELGSHAPAHSINSANTLQAYPPAAPYPGQRWHNPMYPTWRPNGWMRPFDSAAYPAYYQTQPTQSSGPYQQSAAPAQTAANSNSSQNSYGSNMQSAPLSKQSSNPLHVPTTTNSASAEAPISASAEVTSVSFSNVQTSKPNGQPTEERTSAVDNSVPESKIPTQSAVAPSTDKKMQAETPRESQMTTNAVTAGTESHTKEQDSLVKGTAEATKQTGTSAIVQAEQAIGTTAVAAKESTQIQTKEQTAQGKTTAINIGESGTEPRPTPSEGVKEAGQPGIPAVAAGKSQPPMPFNGAIFDNRVPPYHNRPYNYSYPPTGYPRPIPPYPPYAPRPDMLYGAPAGFVYNYSSSQNRAQTYPSQSSITTFFAPKATAQSQVQSSGQQGRPPNYLLTNTVSPKVTSVQVAATMTDGSKQATTQASQQVASQPSRQKRKLENLASDVYALKLPKNFHEAPKSAFSPMASFRSLGKLLEEQGDNVLEYIPSPTKSGTSATETHPAPLAVKVSVTPKSKSRVWGRRRSRKSQYARFLTFVSDVEVDVRFYVWKRSKYQFISDRSIIPNTLKKGKSRRILGREKRILLEAFLEPDRVATHNTEESPSKTTRVSNHQNETAVSPTKLSASSSRVGRKYQASVPPRPMQIYRPGALCPGYDQIWDPAKASKAIGAGEDIENFIKNGIDITTKALLMEALHSSRYRVSKAMETFVMLYRRAKIGKNSCTQLGLDEQFRANKMFVSYRKDFPRICQQLGNKSMASLLTHYYRWKRTHPQEYKTLKGSRKKESDYCAICDDGGQLIVCEGCSRGYHMTCLDPPLVSVPTGDWFCFMCTGVNFKSERESTTVLSPTISRFATHASPLKIRNATRIPVGQDNLQAATSQRVTPIEQAKKDSIVTAKSVVTQVVHATSPSPSDEDESSLYMSQDTDYTDNA